MPRRPSQTPARRTPGPVEIAAAEYVGSCEHKSRRWWAGLPCVRVDSTGRARRPKKQDTTICPLVTAADRARATSWVRAALSSKQFRFLDADRDYPGRIWYRDEDGALWIGYCINTVQGHYKGWPITEEERRAVFG